MFDPTIETPVPLAQVPRLPWLRRLRRRGGRPLHLSTVHRWVQSGLKIGEQVVKLECLRVGGQLVTSEAALSRFFARCADPAAPVDTRAKARREHERAEAELAAAGI
jgi:hypothetical protein